MPPSPSPAQPHLAIPVGLVARRLELCSYPGPAEVNVVRIQARELLVVVDRQPASQEGPPRGRAVPVRVVRLEDDAVRGQSRDVGGDGG